MGTTRFNWEGLKNWVQDQNAPAEKTAINTVSRGDLTKVGGLFRVRDDYETVWKMEAGEDGRSYITRIGEEGTEERVLVSEDTSAENYSKTAYRTIREGLAHIVWECEECSTPNITKEGNAYECDGCHHKYPEVLSHNPKPEVYDRSAVAELFGDWAVEKMRREGISKINKDLLVIWAKEKDPEWKETEEEDYDDEFTEPPARGWRRDKSEDFHSDGSRKGALEKDAGGADCPKCGDYVDPQFKEKHKKNCPGN